MKSIFTRMSLTVGLAAILSTMAFAQTPAPQDGTTNNDAPHGRHGRMGRMGKHRRGGGHQMGFGLRRLNLSDAQRGQLRDIEARYSQNSRAQREEMRQLFELRRQGTTLTPEQQTRAQQLRTELRANGEQMHNEILALLTPEQREQLKQMREERKARREERRAKFGLPRPIGNE